MEALDIIIDIVLILLFASLIALAIYLIIALKKITASVDQIKGTVADLKVTVDPLIVNANQTIANVNDITANVKLQMSKVDNIVSNVQQRANSILELERKAQSKIEEPLMESVNMVSATLKGVKAFFQKLSDSTDRRKPLVKDDFIYNDYDKAPDEL